MTNPPPQRILSIDIFRGLTMVVMIFVNDLASVKGLPWWTYHMPRGVNGMTYVDVVFPAFLFIVGMAIPLAVERRLARGGGQVELWKHILLRFAGLAVLGLFLANWSKLDPQLTGMSLRAWSLTGLAGALLLWNAYPRGAARRWLYMGLRGAGFVMLAAMLAIFRRSTPDGQAAWLDFRYWEILGLIGRTYLAVCVLYVPLRKKPWAPAALLVGLCLLNAGSRVGWMDWLRQLSPWAWQLGRGDFASITMAGIVAAQIFLGRPGLEFRRRALEAAGYAAALFAAGALLLGFGVTKLGATPAWCLWCAGISVALMLGLYWLVDVKGASKWAWFAKPAGENTLLTYLVPDIYYASGLAVLAAPFSSGWPGLARAFVMTAVMLAAAGVLTRLKVRLQL